MTAAILVCATYIYFLLFAQFAFLHGVRDHVADPSTTNAILGAMALAGIAASLITPGLTRRFGFARVLAAGLLTASVAAFLAAAVLARPAGLQVSLLYACSASAGGSLGVSTVALAAGLRALTQARNIGLKVGCGTAAAYFACNLPFVFEASPPLQSALAGLVGLGGGAVALRTGRDPANDSDDPDAASSVAAAWYRPLGLACAILVFLALVWFDSAAFAAVQLDTPVREIVWGGSSALLLNGMVHAGAAVTAGRLLDRGMLLTTWIAAFVALVVGASWFSLTDVRQTLSAPLYASGVSLYSTALAAFAALGARTARTVSPAGRAALVYAIAGWMGSTLGVGLAESRGSLPDWAPAMAGTVLTAAMTAFAISRSRVPER